MILGFTKHAWGKHNLFIKLGGGTLGFIGENLGRAKGKFFFLFLSRVCFLLWCFKGYKEWIIQLNWKIIHCTWSFKIWGQRVRNSFFSFQKGFIWVNRGGSGNSTPFQGGFFLRRIFKGLGEMNCFWDGDKPKGLFLGWYGKEKFGYFSK